MAEIQIKRGSEFSPAIYPEELTKIIPATGQDLIILTIQNGFFWGIHEEFTPYLAPVVVFSVAPVPDRVWEDFLETWFKVLNAGVPVMAAYEKALDGVSSDFPEAQELFRVTVNRELVAERAYQEPQMEAEKNQSQEEETGEEENVETTEEEAFSSRETSGSALTRIGGRAHADHPTADEEKDWLGYRAYAQIISRIIQDPKSEPPLSIAVIGPWGQGKSSLMRMIQRRVKTQAPDVDAGQQRPATIRDILSWTRTRRNWFRRLSRKKNHPGKSQKRISYPTVWFNPWEYQSTSQIWAGMADAIINQIVEHLPRLKREKFWFNLHLKRIDTQAIRQRIYRDGITRAMPWLAIFGITGIICASLILTGAFSNVLAVLGFVSAGGLITGITAFISNLQSGLGSVYDQYLQAPDYEKELGMFHHVNDDLDRVFDLLVDQPAVIFIDDLDRCSPEKVVEVIEAINLIMNARFREKCYFVIGMDAEMVAAALDVAYHGMKGKFPGKEKNLGSVGWYFLDKFIQVPVVLPTMSERDKTLFLQKLFDDPSPRIPNARDLTSHSPEIKQAAREILASAKTKDSGTMEQAREETRSRGTENELDEAILEQAYKATEDSEDIQQHVKEFATYLDPSPRGIKRFANLLRFYTAQQQLRETKSLPSAGTEALAKWLIITLRWPMLVRWLQWREDQGIFHPINLDAFGQPQRILRSHIPEDKARVLDELVQEGPPDITDDPYWQSLSQNNDHLPWMADKDLVRILTEKNRPEDQLSRAFECDVW